MSLTTASDKIGLLDMMGAIWVGMHVVLLWTTAPGLAAC